MIPYDTCTEDATYKVINVLEKVVLVYESTVHHLQPHNVKNG